MLPEPPPPACGPPPRRCRLDSAGTDSSADSSSTTGSVEGMGTEVVIRPRLPSAAAAGPLIRNEYEVARKKEGDVAKEKLIEERMKALGVYDSKRCLERLLAQRLEDEMEQDSLIGALRRCRRRRPLAERVTSVTEEITNVIRPSVVRDSRGNKHYKVEILMGLFTKDVRHEVTSGQRVVVISGAMPAGPKLTKEITVEFPSCVDIEKLRVTFNAGVFRMTAPFFSKSGHKQGDTNDLVLDTSLDTISSGDSLFSPFSDASSKDLGEENENSKNEEES